MKMYINSKVQVECIGNIQVVCLVYLKTMRKVRAGGKGLVYCPDKQLDVFLFYLKYVALKVSIILNG